MSEFEGMVWVIEVDHAPLIRRGKVVSFPCGAVGTIAVRKYLNTFPTNDGHYYDAVIYRSPAALRVEAK
jgi:hypothetical protein